MACRHARAMTHGKGSNQHVWKRACRGCGEQRRIRRYLREPGLNEVWLEQIRRNDWLPGAMMMFSSEVQSLLATMPVNDAALAAQLVLWWSVVHQRRRRR